MSTDKKTVSIPFKWVAITAYAVLVIPILIFFFGWLRWYWAILFSLVLLFGIGWMIKKEYLKKQDKLEIPMIHTFIAIIVLGLWVIYAGNCGVSVSNYDTQYRTAVLRDLVEYGWPVYYPQTGGNLVYYLTFWMVPALVGKVLGMNAAFVALWLWQFIVVVLSFLLILYLIKDVKPHTVWTSCLFFMMWSGLNVIGAIVTDVLGLNLYGFQLGLNENYCDMFFNGESFNFYYRSNQDFICEPYNQIVIWLCVPLMLENRQIKNYAVIGLLIFPYSPWATIGIALLMIADIINSVKEMGFVRFAKEAISIQNICVLLSVFVVFGLFFTSSSRIGGNSEGSFGVITLSKFDSPRILGLVIFWNCEFLIYFIFLYTKNKQDKLFKSLLPILLFIPFFWIGNIWGRDFCMNVSLPALFVLMIYMIKYFLEEVWHKELNLKIMAFICCLVIAASSPVMDWAVKAKTMISNKSMSVQNDSTYTYSNKNPEEYGNFVVTDADRFAFFKILSKKSNISVLHSEISSITNIDDYFDYLNGKDYTVLIAVQDIQGFSLRQETVDRLKYLGYNDDINLLMEREYHAFIGITDNGNFIYQQVGQDEHIAYSGAVNGDKKVQVESATLNYGNFSVISVDGADYSKKGRGLNIVVIDNASGYVIDSVAFDTHVDEMVCTR